MDEPTDRQLEVLMFIIGYRAEHGYPPTLRRLMDHFGMASTNSVAGHLRALRRKGLLEWEYGNARTLHPLVEFIPDAQLESASTLAGVTEDWK